MFSDIVPIVPVSLPRNGLRYTHLLRWTKFWEYLGQERQHHTHLHQSLIPPPSYPPTSDYKN